MLAMRVVLLFIVIHTTALFPPAVFFRYVILELMGRNVFHLVAAIFLLTLDLLLLLLSCEQAHLPELSAHYIAEFGRLSLRQDLSVLLLYPP